MVMHGFSRGSQGPPHGDARKKSYEIKMVSRPLCSNLGKMIDQSILRILGGNTIFVQNTKETAQQISCIERGNEVIKK